MTILISSLQEALKVGDLIDNKEYPIGTEIDFIKYGFPAGRTFSVITTGRSVFNGCRYEGYGDLFSLKGQMLPDIAFFRLEQFQDDFSEHDGD